jgi:hypothetical protein
MLAHAPEAWTEKDAQDHRSRRSKESLNEAVRPWVHPLMAGFRNIEP